MPEQITIKLVSYAEREVTVDRAKYEQAKAAGELDHMLDAYASNMDEELTVIEPAEMGGQEIDYSTGEPIPTAD
jgi:hypothetical protein